MASSADSLLDQQQYFGQQQSFRTIYRQQLQQLQLLMKKLLPLHNPKGGKDGAVKGVVVFLLDVEGTTTPLPFVTKVLYPESEVKLAAYCQQNYKDLMKNEIIAASKACAEVAAAINSSTVEEAKVLTAFVAHLKDLISKNSKAPYLKSIQGKIWKLGYETGAIEGHLFTDVANTMRHIAVEKLAEVHIFSSGSIQAQKLLFRYSSSGDLTPYIHGYHDTVTAGPKFQAKSYQKIRAKIAQQRAVEEANVHIVFLTDILAEIRAAHAAGGIVPVLSLRPLNHRLAKDDIEATGIPRPLLALCSFEQMFPQGRKADAILGTLYDDVQRYKSSSSVSAATPQKLKSFL